MKSWCIGKPSAQYVAKMEDVLDVYARPYDTKRPLVCLDEVSKELHATPRGTLPLEPGQPVKDFLSEGQPVQVRVLHVDASHQRMGLSLKID